MEALFMSFGPKNMASGQKFVHNINGNPNFPWEDKLFFPIYTNSTICIMDFYWSSWSNGHNVKCPPNVVRYKVHAFCKKDINHMHSQPTCHAKPMNGENRQLITDWLTLDELDLQTLGRKTQG